MYGKYPHPEPIERGMRLVMSRQRPVSLIQLLSLKRPALKFDMMQDGSWAQEALEGIFNKTVTIAYPNFKLSFTIWMLGKAHHYLAVLKGEKTNGHANGHSNGHSNGHTNGHANGH